MQILARFNLENYLCKLASAGTDVYISPSCCVGFNLSELGICIRITLHRATARMAKLVDAWDLKSPVRKDVPVRFRLRAPSKIKGLRAKADANPCLLLGRRFEFGHTHLVAATLLLIRYRMSCFSIIRVSVILCEVGAGARFKVLIWCRKARIIVSKVTRNSLPVGGHLGRFRSSPICSMGRSCWRFEWAMRPLRGCVGEGLAEVF